MHKNAFVASGFTAGRADMRREFGKAKAPLRISAIFCIRGGGGGMHSERAGRSQRWQRKVITLAVGAALSAEGELAFAAPANPVGGGGPGGFAHQGKGLSIPNTPRAIINWKSFLIAQ